MAGFLLGLTVTFLGLCRRLSFDYWIRRLARKTFASTRTSDLYVDGLVLADVLASMASFYFVERQSYYWAGNWLGWTLVGAAIYRIADIVTFQALQILGGSGNPGGRKTYAGFERTLLLTFINFVAIALWFACCYAFLRNQGALAIKAGVPEGLALVRESLMMMVLNSTDAFEKPSALTYRFFVAHILVGLFMTTIIVSRTIGLLRSPKLDSEELAEALPARPPEKLAEKSGETPSEEVIKAPAELPSAAPGDPTKTQ